MAEFLFQCLDLLGFVVCRNFSWAWRQMDRRQEFLSGSGERDRPEGFFVVRYLELGQSGEPYKIYGFKYNITDELPDLLRDVRTPAESE
jgi:hypothetical protein